MSHGMTDPEWNSIRNEYLRIQRVAFVCAVWGALATGALVALVVVRYVCGVVI